VLSALADTALRVQLLRESVQEYLVKPFFPEELRVRVANLLAMKQVRQALQQEVTTQNQNLEHLAKEAALQKRENQQTLEALQQANEHLAHASQVQRNFVAMVGREFRTPLTSILGFSDLMRKQLSVRRRSRSIPPISMCRPSDSAASLQKCSTGSGETKFPALCRKVSIMTLNANRIPVVPQGTCSSILWKGSHGFIGYESWLQETRRQGCTSMICILWNWLPGSDGNSSRWCLAPCSALHVVWTSPHVVHAHRLLAEIETILCFFQ